MTRRGGRSPARRRPSAVAQLVEAMKRCVVADGEAIWTNGYRTAYMRSRNFEDREEGRLRARQSAQYAAAALAEIEFRRLAARLLRDARNEGATR